MVDCIIIYNGSTYEGGTFISYRRGLCVACLCRIGNAKASNRGTGNGTVPALFLRISNKDCLHVVTAPSAYRNEEIDVNRLRRQREKEQGLFRYRLSPVCFNLRAMLLNKKDIP